MKERKHQDRGRSVQRSVYLFQRSVKDTKNKQVCVCVRAKKEMKDVEDRATSWEFHKTPTETDQI